MVTKLEVNIRSLLLNCEELSKDESNFWRLKKFIKSLETMIDELKETNEASNQQAIGFYFDRLQSLKTIANYIDSPPSANRLKSKVRQQESGDSALKEINQLQNSKLYSDLRKELINDDTLRRRKPEQGETMDQAMKYYANAQEKIAEDMLLLTRSLKEQTETANRIIKRDTEIVGKSSQMSDRNIDSLSKEAELLQDHSRKAWKCWMWLMIAFVMVIFIFMVLFMKVMKKKTA